MEIKEMLLTSLKVLMIASIAVIAFAGGDLFEMFRDSVLQQQGFAIPINGFMFQVISVLALVAFYPVDLMRKREVAILKRFAIISIAAILLTILIVNLILIVNTLLNFEFELIQVIFYAGAIFSIILSITVLRNISYDSTDNQILSFVDVIHVVCITSTSAALVTYQGVVQIELFSGLFPWTLIFTAFIAIYHSKIRWNQQNGIKEIA
ncbi:TPA: hypothetical protein ACVU5M_000213 [Vibrio parahaemolyticus]